MCCNHELTSAQGFAAAQLCLIFSSSEQRRLWKEFREKGTEPAKLALLHQFRISNRSDTLTGFFAADRVRDTQGNPVAYITPLDNIVQPAPLTPRFRERAIELGVNNDNCIDECDEFYINSFHSAHTYQTIY
jgi:hypothetical protein